MTPVAHILLAAVACVAVWVAGAWAVVNVAGWVASGVGSLSDRGAFMAFLIALALFFLASVVASVIGGRR